MNTFKQRAQELVAHGCIQPDRACEGKIRYLTQNDARHAAKDAAKRMERMFGTYRCPFCHFYHVTRHRHGEGDAA